MRELTDLEVLTEALPIVENQWCEGTWCSVSGPNGERGVTNNADFYAGVPGWQVRYCMVGALEKVLGLVTTDVDNLGEEEARRVDKVCRHLVKTMAEQYPEGEYRLDGRDVAGQVESFNDNFGRDKMLSIVEKTIADLS